MASKKTKSAFVAPLRTFALGLPGAYEDHPWGETVAKVASKGLGGPEAPQGSAKGARSATERGKVFVFFGQDTNTEFGMSVKLPQSKSEALSLEYCEPTGYGLGKSGWVSVNLAKARTAPDVDMLTDWILESYRAIAPKKMLAELEARRLQEPSQERPAAKTARKPAKKKKKKSAPKK